MRLPDWERRLRAVIEHWSTVEHGWHATCGDWGADIVEAVTGRDIRPLIGLPVRSAREAAALYRTAGVSSLAGAVASVLGTPVPLRAARRGDVVMTSGDAAIGVCLGDRAAFLADRGVDMLSMSVAAKVWPLG